MRVRKQPVGSVAVCESPSVDPIEARWAAEAVGSLSRQLGTDSLVAMVLEQAQRELNSLAVSSAPAADDVFGPVRVRVAA
jgi:hypothetical protein